LIAAPAQNRMIVVQVREAKGKGGGIADVLQGRREKRATSDLHPAVRHADQIRADDWCRR